MRDSGNRLWPALGLVDGGNVRHTPRWPLEPVVLTVRPLGTMASLMQQRGGVFENHGQSGVDGDHGVLGAVVVLHFYWSVQCFAFAVRVLGVVLLFSYSCTTLEYS